MQDWEYGISNKEKRSLMEVILDSSKNLLVGNKTVEFEKFFLAINERSKKKLKSHGGIIHYWKTNDFEIRKRLIDERI